MATHLSIAERDSHLRRISDLERQLQGTAPHLGTDQWFKEQWGAGVTTTVMAQALGWRALQVATRITNLRRRHPADFPKRRVKGAASDQLPLRKLLGLLKEAQAGCTDTRLGIAVKMVEKAYNNRVAAYQKQRGGQE